MGEIENVIVCEDILSDEVCATLRKAAEKLKVGAKIVDQFIREALEKGKTKAKEIIKYIEDKMAALSKVKCEQVLDEDICKKIREVAAKVKISMAKVEKVIKEIVAKGITKIQEIIKMGKEYFFPTEVENVIVCEDVLSKEMCATLRKAAEKLKVGAKIVDQFIREALDKGKKKAKEIIKYIEDKMAALSKVKCEDILDEDICKKVREVAAKVKVEMKKVEEVMKKIVAKGIVKIQEIIKKIKEYFFPGMELELENEVKCEDVLADDVCAKLREAAKKLKLKVEEINKLIEEAVAKGKKKVDEIIDYVHKRMVDLSKIKCAEIIDYIKKHFPHLGEELVNEITCEEILSDKV